MPNPSKQRIPAEPHAPRYAPQAIESAQVQRTRLRIQDAARRAFGRKGTATSINDIVEAAGISRPSFYNYYGSVEALFEAITGAMIADLNSRIVESFGDITDSARRVSIGIRQYCRRAHEDPDWANFLLHFALTNPSIVSQARVGLIHDLETGVRSGRFRIRVDQIPAAFGAIVGGVLTAMMAVRAGAEGHITIGQQAAEAALRMLGMTAREARSLSQAALTEVKPPPDMP